MAVGVAAGVSVQANAAKETKATLDQTMVYVDITSSMWTTASATDVKMHLWGSSINDVYLYSESTHRTIVTVQGVQYAAFDLTDYISGAAGLDVYCWERDKTGNISQWITLSTFTSGQNLIIVGNSGSWSTNQPYTLGTLNVSTLKTITKIGVYNGTADYDYPLGTDSVDSGETYAKPVEIYKPGNIFGGWYTDEECETPYTARTITSDMYIYAKYTWKGTWSDYILIDLRSSGWDDVNANYAVYFYGSLEGQNAWSSYTSVTAGTFRIIINYSIGFNPENNKMVLMRYNGDYSQSAWESDPWNTSVWYKSADLDFSEYIAIGDYKDETWAVYTGDDFYPSITGQPSGGSWGDIKYLVRNSRLTNEGHMEYFRYTFDLSANSTFKVVHANEYYGYTLATFHESIADNFTKDDWDNIVCSTAGTYSVIFDSYSHAFSIATQGHLDADEWASELLGTDVDIDTCEHTMHYWDTAKATYEGVFFSEEARALCLAEEHVGPNDPVTTLLARAIQRYDHVLRVYGVYDEEKNPDGYVDYIGRVVAGKLSLSHPISILGGFDNNNTTPIIVIVIVSLVAVTTIGGYFYLRKRKQD